MSRSHSSHVFTYTRFAPILKRCFFVFLAVCLLQFLYATNPFEPKLWLTRVNQNAPLVESRLSWWDWKDTDDEVMCRNANNTSQSRDPVPNTVHYVLLGEGGAVAEMTYRSFLSIKASLVRLKPEMIKIHTFGLNRSNSWWKQLERHVSIVEYDRDSFRGPQDRPMDDFLVQHQSDFLRLHVLTQEGGIYLDTDIYPLKPWTDLLNSTRDIVMGHEGGNRYGLCNAVIIARNSSEFLHRWIDRYDSFDRHVWNFHSVKLPKQLQVLHPELICPLSPTVFFYPTWAKRHRRYMQEYLGPQEIGELLTRMAAYGGVMYENQLALHGSPGDLTAEDILIEETRFNILMRNIVDAPLP